VGLPDLNQVFLLCSSFGSARQVCAQVSCVFIIFLRPTRAFCAGCPGALSSSLVLLSFELAGLVFPVRVAPSIFDSWCLLVASCRSFSRSGCQFLFVDPFFGSKICFALCLLLVVRSLLLPLDFSLRPQILAHSYSWCPESLPSSFHFAHGIFISCERVSAVDPSLVVFLIFPHVGVLSFGLHRSSDSAAVPSPHAWFVHRLSFLRAGVDPASSCPASIL
jgi:hypothetical protein